MPTLSTKRYILLRDLHGGVHGRVWLACSSSGRICVLKFPQQSGSEDSLRNELNIWNNVWNIPAQLKKISDRLVLIMPFVKPCNEEPISEDIKEAVINAITIMAKAGFIHKDLR